MILTGDVRAPGARAGDRRAAARGRRDRRARVRARLPQRASWDDYFLSADHLIRLDRRGAPAASLAVFSARARARGAGGARAHGHPGRGRAHQRRAERRRRARAAGRRDRPRRGRGVLGRPRRRGRRRCAARSTRGEQEGGDERRACRCACATRRSASSASPARSYDRRRPRASSASSPAASRSPSATSGSSSELSRTRERLDRILGSLAEAVTVHDADGQHGLRERRRARDAGPARARRRCPPSPGSLAARFIVTHEDGTPVRHRGVPGPPADGGRARPAAGAHAQRAARHRARVLAADEGDAAGTTRTARRSRSTSSRTSPRPRTPSCASASSTRPGQVLASSLDYEQALRRVCELAVPGLADWAAVDLAAARRDRARVRSRTATPPSSRWPRSSRGATRPTPTRRPGVPAVVRSGSAERYDAVPDELLREAARDEEHLRLIRELGLRRGDDRSDDGRRRDRRRDDASCRRRASGVRRRRLRVRAGPRAARRDGGAERPPVRRAGAGGAARSSAACCPTGSPTCRAGRRARRTRPATRGPRSAATSTTSSPTERGHLVILGDVTGKGVEAAALTALVRHSAQMAARFDPRPGRDPGAGQRRAARAAAGSRR